MSVHVPGTFVDSGRTNPGHVFTVALWLLWQCIRLPLFLLFAILEPVVSFVFGSLALLGVLMAQRPVDRLCRFGGYSSCARDSEREAHPNIVR